MKNLPFATLVFAMLVSCSEGQKSSSAQKNADSGRPVVQTVNYPLYYFTKRLAGEHFDVQYLVPEGIDPAFWEPADKDIQAFQKADLVIRNGADYAKWMQTTTLPTANMLDTSAAFSSRIIKTKGKMHQHGNGKAHSHGAVAFTIWMDFSQAEQQAKAIADRLAVLSPEPKPLIRENFQKLSTDLKTLDADMSAWAKQWGSKALLVSHPVYQYWARRYSINMKAVHWEPDMKWEPARKAEIETLNADHHAKWMLWEGEPAPELVKELKSLGINSAVLDPCGNTPGKGEDWLSMMKKNIATLKKLKP